MKKEHDYLICIDSDGCAMDTMNSKHFYCFGPEWVKQYGLEDIQEEALKYWNQINLYSKTRGINRFKGLAMGLEWAKEKGYETEGQEEFVAWTKEAPELSNPAERYGRRKRYVPFAGYCPVRRLHARTDRSRRQAVSLSFY